MCNHNSLHSLVHDDIGDRCVTMLQPSCFLLAIITVILAIQKTHGTTFNAGPWKYTLYVDGNTGSNTKACWSGIKPCQSLDYVASVVNDSTTVVIMSSNTLPQGLGQVAAFQNLVDIRISAEPNSSVLVRCDNNSGLKFVDVTNLVITNVHFVYCGSLQNSSSASYNDPMLTFEFRSAIYLLNCTNVTLSSVACTLGAGAGVAMYDVGGTVTVEDCVFADNGESNKEPVYPVGGGLYIEHTSCSVGNHDSNSCKPSSNPFSHNNSYLITGSYFRNNHANTVSQNAVTFVGKSGPEVQRLGWGGGLMISLRGAASGNNFTIDNCTFHGNSAPIGGAIAFGMNQEANNNKITVSNSQLEWNTAHQGGGGVHFGYMFFNNSSTNKNMYSFYKVKFSLNSAVYGGSVAVYSTRTTCRDANQIVFAECNWELNTANIGAAVALFPDDWTLINGGFLPTPHFENCTFNWNFFFLTRKQMAERCLVLVFSSVMN